MSTTIFLFSEILYSFNSELTYIYIKYIIIKEEERCMKNRIKELRKKNGMTLVELAQKLEISPSMLSNYEKGTTTPRDSTVWEKLAEIFNVSLSHVMGTAIDINTIRKPLEVPVDTSKPIDISLNIKTQADLDILTYLTLFDEMEEEDRIKIVDYFNQILSAEKYDELRSRICLLPDRIPIKFVMDK